MRNFFILLFTVTGFCNPAFSQRINYADTNKNTCFQTTGQLLDEVLGFMQKKYYRRNQVEWDQLISGAKAKLNASRNCDEAYDAIAWCFTQLGEQHSFVMPPAKAAIYNNDTTMLRQVPPISDLVGELKGEWLNDTIAYLTLPWVRSTDSLTCIRIADSIQELIARLDTRKISGWIIDLRKNNGGNCWPMLAGIGPLLRDGICGYFVSDHEKVSISYRDGAIYQGRHVRCQVSKKTYHLRSDKPFIAVLTGSGTVSAGEIVALAFKGRENTYLYGQATRGLTTVNATYPLSDRSMLVLTVCQEADCTGRVCEGSIAPDRYIAFSGLKPEEDPVKTAAIQWLQTGRTNNP